MGLFKWMFGPKPAVKKVTEAAEIVKTVNSKPDTAFTARVPKKVITKTQMMNLSKDQLEQIGRENGVELDKRKTKQKLIDVLHKKLVKNSKK